MKINNPEKLLETLISSRQGDSQCTLILLEKYKPLILKHSSTYILKNFETEDLIQLGNLSVLTAIQKYDINKGGCNYIDCYIINSIKNTYRNLARNNIRYKSESSLDISADSDNCTLVDLIMDDFDTESHIINTLEITLLKELLLSLPEEDFKLISAAYLTPKTSLRKYCIENDLNYYKTRRYMQKVLSDIKYKLKNSSY